MTGMTTVSVVKCSALSHVLHLALKNSANAGLIPQVFDKSGNALSGFECDAFARLIVPQGDGGISYRLFTRAWVESPSLGRGKM